MKPAAMHFDKSFDLRGFMVGRDEIPPVQRNAGQGEVAAGTSLRLSIASIAATR